VIPWVRVGNGFYSLFLHCLRAEMPFRCKQAFPREKCLLDHLWPFGTSCSLSFCPSHLWEYMVKFSLRSNFRFPYEEKDINWYLFVLFWLITLYHGPGHSAVVLSGSWALDCHVPCWGRLRG
jgi:hypothetical protein